MKNLLSTLFALASISAFAENEGCGKIYELKINPPSGASNHDHVNGKIQIATGLKSFSFISSGLASTLTIAKQNNTEVCIGNESSSITKYVKIRD